jgi:prophage protein (ps3)
MGNKGTIFDAAYYILTKINQTTFMNLQRLCYYAQAWSITWDKFALFEEEFEAWAGGPVCPELYNIFDLPKDLNVNADKLKPYISGYCFSKDEKETLDFVIKVYSNKEPHWLSELIRKEDPWRKTRDDLSIKEPSNAIISKKMMSEYYSSLFQ